MEVTRWRVRWGLVAVGALVAGLAGAFLAYNSAYFAPFGGDGPGARFLTPVLPFLALPIAAAYARFPLTTAVLGCASLLTMTAATVTEPLLASHTTSRWLERIAEGEMTATLLTDAGLGSGWTAIAPVLVAAAAAAAAAAASTPVRAVSRVDARVAVGAVFAWLAVALAGARVLDPSRPAGTGAIAGFLGLLVLVGLALAGLSGRISIGWASRLGTR